MQHLRTVWTRGRIFSFLLPALLLLGGACGGERDPVTPEAPVDPHAATTPAAAPAPGTAPAPVTPPVAPPVAHPLPAVTAIGTPEAALTRVAHARGYLARDPYAALGAHAAVVWRHGDLVVRPLTGAVVAAAEDLRVPLDSADLVLVRVLTGSVAGAPPRWDEGFGLGPSSPRCEAGAACDADGRVLAWHEDGRRFTVAWDGDRPRAIHADGRALVELVYGPGGLTELRAGGVASAGPLAVRATYTRDGAGRIARVTTTAATRYAYDARGRLVEVAHGRATTRITYDDVDRVTSLTGPGALSTRVVYAAPADGLRADVAVTDALGETTRFTWAAPSTAGVSEVRAGAGPRASSWAFDAAGRIVAHEAAGARTRYAYDARGRLVEVGHPDGLVQRLERRADQRLAAVAEGPRTTAFTLTATGDLATVGVSDAHRETWTWAASAGGAPRLVRITHASGRYEAFARDAVGRVLRYESSEGPRYDYRYDEVSGLLAAVRDEDGAETSWAYDDRGRVIRSVRPDGSVEAWTWDAEGRVATHTEVDRTRTFEYDEGGRLARLRLAGGITEWTYDALGRPLVESGPLGTTRYRWRGADLVEVTEPSGVVVTRALDAFGRPVREVSSVGARQERVWAAPADGGYLLVEAEPGLVERRFTWDALARLTRLEERGAMPGATRDLRFFARDDGGLEVKDAITGAAWTHRQLPPGPGVTPTLLLSTASSPSGAVESYRYDARGRLSEKTSSHGDSFTLTWDARGRPATSAGAAGTTRFSWTPLGQLAALEPELGPARRFEYDPAGRLVAVSEGERRWRMGYSGLALSELVDPAGRLTRFAWDARQRLASRAVPGSGVTRYRYDDAGRLAGEVRADGSAHTFTWDALGRLTRHDVGGAPVRTLRWDDQGRLAADDGPGHALGYAYDDRDGVSRRTTTDARAGVTTTRTRDAAGRTRRVDVGDRLHARYVWRADGRLSRVEAGSGFAVELEHDPFGRRTGLRLPGGGALRYGFDASRRLVSLEVTGEGGATYAARFEYDAAGRLGGLSARRGGATTAPSALGYAYDDHGRLAALTLPDASRQAYGWTAAGELVALAGRVVIHDEAGRPVSDRRAYDAVGRLTARDGATLAYEPSGHLARVAAGSGAIRYRYDGDGRLRARTDATSELTFVWDGGELLQMRTATSLVEHVAGERAGERFGFIADGEPRYLVRGPDGSTLAVVDGAGEVLTTYLHEPFGRTLRSEGAAHDPLRYRGHYADPNTGLVHFPMRWYDPDVGAFIAPDPEAGDAMEPATLHRYAYLGGDPVNLIDPLGAQAFEWGPETCLEAVCKLFQGGKINPVHAIKEGFTYLGSVERQGWTYDVWAKQVPGTDRVVTVFRDLNERAEGLFQGAGLSDNIVLKPDGPRGLRLPRPPPSVAPTTSAAPAKPGLLSRAGSAIREGYEQAKIGVQLYGKEVTGTVGGLGGLSGTLGTSVGTLAALPGGALIISAGVALAGAVGYGIGSAINLIPGVSDVTQSLFSKVMGYETDQRLADQRAEMEQEGAKAREHREQKIAESLARDTMPPPPDYGVAGGTVGLFDPPPVDAGGDDEGGAGAELGIAALVPARQIRVPVNHEQVFFAGSEFENSIRCSGVITFWNVGAKVAGHGAASVRASCLLLPSEVTEESTMTGTFTGGPDGTITIETIEGPVAMRLSGGKTISIPKIGTRTLPADAFADWPPGR